ncbi:hypothetical protein CGLAMM_11075 [Acetobacteraceae bacterium EV16G]
MIDLEGKTRRLNATHLLPFYGLSTDLGPILGWNLAVTRNTLPVMPVTMETSQPGIFAIGDVASYPGKLKLILQGFSEGAMAAHAIILLFILRQRCILSIRPVKACLNRGDDATSGGR